eukprot:scaffold166845_cov22-Tisochrysis_lutea.AAC.1
MLSERGMLPERAVALQAAGNRQTRTRWIENEQEKLQKRVVQARGQEQARQAVCMLQDIDALSRW